MQRLKSLLVALLFALAMFSRSAAPVALGADTAELAKALAEFDTNVLSAEQRKAAVEKYTGQFNERIMQANQESTRLWKKAIGTSNVDGVEALLKRSRQALRESLGAYQTPTEKLEVHVTKTIPGEGFTIDNVLFTSGRGLWITANLYRPEPAAKSMPGILICHAHHTPKTHEELQDMGMTWARMGCLVLVMDQLGHGERRQHPFRTAKDYPTEYRPSRQDYWFRYDNALELDLVGESLVGWMAWDLMRGVDLLLAQPGIDSKRIALLGSVAGGGDPAAVAAALDERITVAVPFNFGGPQPETRFPLPEDAEASVNFAGSGGWESTRNLRGSINEDPKRGTFLPWEIVGSIAPRKLIYAHEFAWDKERDPVWKRLESIYFMHQVKDGLDYTHGAGSVRGSSPTDTHCTHIGKVHRQRIHEALTRWWGLPNGVEQEYKKRVPFEELMVLTPELRESLKSATLSARLGKLADERLTERRGRPAQTLTPAEPPRPPDLKLLGLYPDDIPQFKVATATPAETVAGCSVQRISLQVKHELTIPLLLIVPPRPAQSKDAPPVVVGIAQSGKEGFLKHRSAEIAALLKGGVSICLPDLRGTGETRAGSGRDRTTGDTDRSSTEQMLGSTLMAARLADLSQVLLYLTSRKEGKFRRCALWGESFAEPNAADVNLAVPYGVDGRPKQAEPLGGFLALLGALRAPAVVEAVYVSGGLTSFRSVLDSPFVVIPHDSVVPGLLTTGDLPDLAGALAPRPLALNSLVDGQNRRASAEAVRAAYQPAIAHYKKLDAADKLTLGDENMPVAKWLLAQLGRGS